MLDRVDDARRAMNPERLLPAEQTPQQLIEAREMVHVEVRDEDVADPPRLSWGKPPEISEIKQKRALLKDEIHVKPGIVEGIID